MANPIKIGIIGDYDPDKPSHIATNEALIHCARPLSLNIALQWLPTTELEGNVKEKLTEFAALFCAPGSPYQSYEGALNAIRYARERNVPFIGTCGGFQHAVMEFARHVLGLADVSHEEYNPTAETFVIKALSCSLAGQTAQIYLDNNSKCRMIYGLEATVERFNCNYGMNQDLLGAFDKSGFKIAGKDENGEVRLLEIPEKRFYIATLFQPQLLSTSEHPHPLLVEFLRQAQGKR